MGDSKTQAEQAIDDINLGVIAAGMNDDDEELGVADAPLPSPGRAAPVSYDVPVTPQPRRQIDDYRTVRGKKARQRLSDVFLRYGPEDDPYFKVTVERITQRAFTGDAVVGGWCGEFLVAIDERTIAKEYGGGRFKVIVEGSHPKTQKPGHLLAEVIVDIEGTAKPVGSVVGGQQARDEDRRSRRRRDMDDGYGDEGYDSRYDRVRRRNPNYLGDRMQRGQQQQQPTIIQQPAPDGSAARYMAQALQSALSSQRGPEIDYLDVIERLKPILGQQPGVPSHEITAQLSAQHQAQVEALQNRHESRLSEERERHARDLEVAKRETDRVTLRMERLLSDEQEQRKRDAEQVQRSLDDERRLHQQQLDRAQQLLDDARRQEKSTEDKYQLQLEDARRQGKVIEEKVQQQVDEARRQNKAEVERLQQQLLDLSGEHKKDLERQRGDLDRRVEEVGRMKEEAIRMEQDKLKMLLDHVSLDAKHQVERASDQAKSHITSVEQSRELVLSTERSSKELVQKQLEFELGIARSDKDRIEKRMDEMRKVVDKREDIPSQIRTLLSLREDLGAIGGSSNEAIVVADEKEGGIVNHMKGLLDSRAGEIAGGIIGTAVAGVFQRMQEGPRPQPAPAPGATQQRPPMPAPGPGGPMPPSGPTATPGPGATIEQQAQAMLQGERIPQQTGTHAPPQPQPQQEQQTAAGGDDLIRLKQWISEFEEMVETDADPQMAAKRLRLFIPDEGLYSLVMRPVEEVVGEIEMFAGKTRLLSSPQGLAYMDKVKSIIAQQMQEAQQQAQQQAQEPQTGAPPTPPAPTTPPVPTES